MATPPKLGRISTSPLQSPSTPTLGPTIPPTPVNAPEDDSAPSPSPPSGPSTGSSTPRQRHRPAPLPLHSSLVGPHSRSQSRERGVSPGQRSPHLRVRFPAGNDASSTAVLYPRDGTESDPQLPSGYHTPPGQTTARPALPGRFPSHDRLTPGTLLSPDTAPGTELRLEDLHRINGLLMARPAPMSGTNESRPADALVEEEDEADEKAAHVRITDEDDTARRYALLNSGARSAPASASTSPDLAAHDDNGHVPDLELEKLDRPAEAGGGDNALHEEARQLVRAHTLKAQTSDSAFMVEADQLQSGQQTPVEREDYVPAPAQVKGGILSSLLKLYNEQHPSASRMSLDTYATADTNASPPASGRTTPTRKWYSRSANASTSSLAGLIVGSGHALAAPGRPGTLPQHHHHSFGPKKKSAKKQHKQRIEDQIRITVHIAEILQRQRFILKLCRALMLYGAPTHRLEEYMKMTSRVLEIDGQFLYIPGCMIVSFGDASTHTSDMQLVRCTQGVNLGKLHQTHTIYKEVVHDIIGVEEAMQRLDEVMKAKPLYHPWLCVLIFGFSSAMVSAFGFGGRWIDMPIAFLLGCIVGFLQLIVAPRSDLYSNVFEITASVIVSFLGRAFGSIDDVNLFCFAAIAQGALALILPGYIILCGALELQSKNIVAGSVRMFYAIVYSLFLGFGITLGAAIYGWMDHSATSKTECSDSLSPYFRFIFVPMFTVGLALVNQAHWTQLPIMVFIAGGGYVVSYFSNLHFSQAAELASAIASFAIGILGNLYSRVGHGLAFAAMLPAIFVQVPSGLAAQGSLISGIAVADLIVSNSSDADTEVITTTYYASGTLTTATATIVTSATATSASASATATSSDSLTSGIWTVGMNMIQVSIGIVVGLFIATLAVYPFGKKRSGLFTF